MRPFAKALLVTAWIVAACSPTQSAERETRGGSKKDADRATDADTSTDKSDEKGPPEDKDDSSATDSLAKAQPPGKRRITFSGSKGDEVPGYLWLPADEGRRPAVLLMYGISDDKDSSTIGTVAEALAADGYVAMTFDWPGTGERGVISKQSRIIDPSVKDWTVADYGKALAYLKGLPQVDDDRIAYVGASMGAMTGLAFAKKSSSVKALIAVVPIPNPLWGADDPSQAIGAVAPRPVLCISTADNSDLSGVVCQNVGASGERKTLPGGHELDGMKEQVLELAKDFLDKNL